MGPKTREGPEGHIEKKRNGRSIRPHLYKVLEGAALGKKIEKTTHLEDDIHSGGSHEVRRISGGQRKKRAGHGRGSYDETDSQGVFHKVDGYTSELLSFDDRGERKGDEQREVVYLKEIWGGK